MSQTYEEYLSAADQLNHKLKTDPALAGQRDELIAQFGQLPGCLTREQWNKIYKTQEKP